MAKRIYFPGLNTIRFLAAFSVVIGHIDDYKQHFGFTTEPLPLVQYVMRGSDAVTLFFVLSGFLITYLMIAEIQQTGTMGVRKFYARRILRIWPLYYLVVFGGFIFIPAIILLTGFTGYQTPVNGDLLWKAIPFLLFVPNMVNYIGAAVIPLGHLWTIGIEEQFYLIWPNILKRFRHHLFYAIVGVIIVKIGIINLDKAIVVNASIPQWLRYTVSFLTNFRIESMAIGGIGAYLLFFNRRFFLNIIFHPLVEKAALAFMIANFLFLRGDDNPYNNMLLSTFYTLFIMNVSSNPRSTVKLRNPILDRLGRYSYGIYMYHMLVLYLVLIASSFTGLNQIAPVIYNTILYVVIVALSIGAAALSYHQFEARFIQRKKRFAVVASGDSATMVIPATDEMVPAPVVAET